MTTQYELPQPEDDGLKIPVVGDWSLDKHYYLKRYLDAFTTSMKDKWKGLHYVDLFAGAGIEQIRESDKLEWGSPMLAAQTKFPFTQLHLCEKNRVCVRALRERMKKRNLPNEPQVLHGDANERVKDIVAGIPGSSLSLAFLDPFGLDLRFSTVRLLSERPFDLVIFFPDYLDVLRNWKKVYAKQNSKLDRFMGEGADWRGALESAPRSQWAEVLRVLYERQLRTLDFKYFEYPRICAGARPLYRLILCSRHALAAKLWRGISKKDPNDQTNFDFGEPP